MIFSVVYWSISSYIYDFLLHFLRNNIFILITKHDTSRSQNLLFTRFSRNWHTMTQDFMNHWKKSRSIHIKNKFINLLNINDMIHEKIYIYTNNPMVDMSGLASVVWQTRNQKTDIMKTTFFQEKIGYIG